MNEAAKSASPQYNATDLAMIGNRIIITCSDAEEASRSEKEALSKGLDASTEENRLTLQYEDRKLPQ